MTNKELLRTALETLPESEIGKIVDRSGIMVFFSGSWWERRQGMYFNSEGNTGDTSPGNVSAVKLAAAPYHTVGNDFGSDVKMQEDDRYGRMKNNGIDIEKLRETFGLVDEPQREQKFNSMTQTKGAAMPDDTKSNVTGDYHDDKDKQEKGTAQNTQASGGQGAEERKDKEAPPPAALSGSNQAQANVK
jgi:hypothetical protein